MSTMPGNPHIAAELLEYAGRDQTETQAVVAATLALAYEQRTANLIARFALNVQATAAGVHFNESALAVDGQINQRLGLSDA